MSQRKPKGLVLSESPENADFSTMDVFSGLVGVCLAIDNLSASTYDIDALQQLGMAAKVLSLMLMDRVES